MYGGSGRRISAATLALLNWANPVGLTRTTFLSGTNVMAVAPTVRGKDIRKGRGISFRIQLDTIADGRAVLGPIDENTGYCSRGNIDHVVDGPSPVGIACHVSHQDAQSLLLGNRSWTNPGIQAQEVCNRPGIVGSAPRADWRHVLNQRQQVSTWR